MNSKTIFIVSSALLAAILFWAIIPRAYGWYQLKTGHFSTLADAQQAIYKVMGPQGSKLTEISKFFLQTREETRGMIEAPIEYTVEHNQDSNFPISMRYTYPTGKAGTREYITKTLFVEGREVANYSDFGKVITEPITEVSYTGSMGTGAVATHVQTIWKAAVAAITAKSSRDTAIYFTEKATGTYTQISKLSDLSYRLAASVTIALAQGTETDTTIQVGILTLKQSNCSVSAAVPVLYNKADKTYRFDEVYPALASLCSKPKPKPTSGLLSCSNCWLAPVSKQYGLLSTYAPKVVATGLNGGGAVTPDTKTALTALFADAKDKGVKGARVSSSYRSYSIQVDLFNSYVKSEQKNGLSYNAAVEKANTYSAKAGHSEHQLGTTVDVVSCTKPCTFDNPDNTPLFTYLKANAHKFGFIISYPNGSESYTGYVYEPWHIRYVGKTFALELYNRGYLTKKGFYLYQFLLEKGKY